MKTRAADKARIAREGPKRASTAVISINVPLTTILAVDARAAQWRVTRSVAAGRLLEAGNSTFPATAGGQVDDPEGD